MNSLRISGYDAQFRYHMMTGISRKNVMIEDDIRGGRRVRYRSRMQILEMKRRKIGKYPNTWFLRGTVQNTCKIQGTPNSGLMHKMKSALGSGICAEGGSTKFIELGGKPITSGLSDSEKFTKPTVDVFLSPPAM